MVVEFDNCEELYSTQIDNKWFTATALDYFGLAEVIDFVPVRKEHT